MKCFLNQLLSDCKCLSASDITLLEMLKINYTVFTIYKYYKHSLLINSQITVNFNI